MTNKERKQVAESAAAAQRDLVDMCMGYIGTREVLTPNEFLEKLIERATDHKTLSTVGATKLMDYAQGYAIYLVWKNLAKTSKE